MEFLTKVVKQHKLSIKEKKELDNKVALVIKKINAKLTKAKAMVGGSAAKGTLLKEDFDVDLFVKFDYSFKNNNLSDMLEKALKQFKAQRVQGSRDYFQFSYDKVNYEVVPVLNIRNHKLAINVTDASPLHVNWVKKNAKSKLKDEIILTKVFLKANRLYGAESYIKGFSGHVVDILVINYGGFLKLLKATRKWKHGEIIDPEKHKTAGKLNKAKRGPLIIIDPMQPERNAAAALSTANFRLFKHIAKLFLKKPSEKFFEKKKITVAVLKKKAKENKLIVLEVTPLKGKKDVVGAKMMKAHNHLVKQLFNNEFTIMANGWEWDNKAMFWYILDSEVLPKFMEHVGPPLKEKQHVKVFEKQHKETYIKNKRIYAKVQREYRRPEKLIQALVKDDYVKERTSKVNHK